MQLLSVKCPECDAVIKFSEGRDYAYCTHCGTQVFKYNENEKTVNINKYNKYDKNVNINNSITYTRVDEARLRQLAYKERVFEESKRRHKLKVRLIIVIALFIIALIIAGFFYIRSLNVFSKESIKQTIEMVGGFIVLCLIFCIGAIFMRIIEWIQGD